MLRTVEPEWLDRVDAADPRARRSRRDLRRVNFLMGNAGAVARALAPRLGERPTIVDLGAGDGTFMLRTARKIGQRAAHVMLIDRARAVDAATVARFRALGWEATPLAADATQWLHAASGVDAIVANLFLHHFEGAALARLLALAAARTRLFIACEPRRSRVALAASRCLWAIGCARETREDATISVRAGFRAAELAELWPRAAGWQLSEQPSGPFGHLFVAELA